MTSIDDVFSVTVVHIMKEVHKLIHNWEAMFVHAYVCLSNLPHVSSQNNRTYIDLSVGRVAQSV